MARLVRHLDIQRIRSERKITQKELSRLTGYPQGFISRMEQGKVSTPESFIDKVKEVFGIEDIMTYVTLDGLSVNDEETCEVAVKTEMTDKTMVERLVRLLEKSQQRIDKLEQENEQLRERLAIYKNE